MKKTRLWLFITVLAVAALLTGSVYTYAYHATAPGSIQLYQSYTDATNNVPATSNSAYSPKASCARACHIGEGGLTEEFAGHNYGSGEKMSTHVQGIMAGSDSKVYWEASQTRSFEHGVSVGKHMNEGRNEDYTNTYRAKFGDAYFTSSGGMYGKY
jgi:hypothetical protein